MGDLSLEQYFSAQQGYATTTPLYDENYIAPPIVSEAELSEYVFANYSKTRRPRRDALQGVDVWIGMTLIVINEMWRDEYLVWNDSARFSHIDSLVVFSNEVWTPDWSNVNSGELYTLQRASQLMLLEVKNDGMIEFLPEATITTFCELDMTYFPYDEQECPIRFEAWTFFPQQQMFQLYDPPVNMRKFRPNEQWELLNLTAEPYISCYTNTTADCCYTGMQYMVHVRRKAAFYNINIIAPSLIIAFVEIVIFALPTHEPMKIHISFTCMLAYAVFQNTISAELPRSSEHLPLLSIFINLQMAYIGVALFGEAAVFVCENRATRREAVPASLLKAGEIVAKYLLIDPESIIFVEDAADAAANTEMAIGEIKKVVVSEEYSAFGNKKKKRPRGAKHGSDEEPDNTIGLGSASKLEDIWPNESTAFSSLYADLHDHNQSLNPHGNNYLNNPNFKGSKVDDRTANMQRFQWLFLAEVMDRLTLIVYFLLICLTPLVIFWVMPAADHTKSVF